MNTENCEPLYRDGAVYDAMYAPLVEDRNFFVTRAVASGGPVLEIATGTGRIAIPIAKQGIEITGLDISKGMLSEARRKSSLVTWHEADCREFELEQKFKLIFIAFNSLLHLHSRESLEKFLAQVRRHLRPEGTFMLDIFNPSVQILARDRQKRYVVMDIQDPRTGERLLLEETMTYDSARQVNEVKWYFDLGNGREQRVEDLNMRCLFPQEIDALLHYNGFEIVEKLGDYQATPFNAQSSKQIITCRMRAG